MPKSGNQDVPAIEIDNICHASTLTDTLHMRIFHSRLSTNVSVDNEGEMITTINVPLPNRQTISKSDSILMWNEVICFEIWIDCGFWGMTIGIIIMTFFLWRTIKRFVKGFVDRKYSCYAIHRQLSMAMCKFDDRRIFIGCGIPCSNTRENRKK